MTKRCKVSTKKIFTGLTVVLLFLITFHAAAQGRNHKHIVKSLTDSSVLKRTRDSLAANDSTHRKLSADTLYLSKDSINSPIDYAADDSAILMINQKQFYLFGKATTANKDIKLEAADIMYDQQTQLVTAYGEGLDTGNFLQNKPKITQQGSTSISDTIKFNLKTQKGISKNSYYNEGDIFVHAIKVKRVDKNVEYAYRATFTTCNLDTPHFAIRARKLKLVNNKFAYSGPAFPEFEGVPIPIPIPFGIFPLDQGRHSGLLPPAFTTNENYGIGLEGLGYYKVVNDYWDFKVKADIYSYGGWTLDLNPQYFKRYDYEGIFDLSIQKTKILNEGVLSPQEFTENSSFQINWSHHLDPKADPGTTFSASVQAGSTRYNQYVPNNVLQNFNNNLASSINYGKMWDNGKYNLSATATESQNSEDHLIQLSLPTVNFAATTIYPFQKAIQIGAPKWYQKLGISYTGTLLNQVSFYDTSAFRLKNILDTFQWGAEHRIPITLSLPPVGPVFISPSVSYSENWYGQRLLQNWDPALDKVDSTIEKGFYTAREMDFGLAFNTKLYGTYNFKSGTVEAIRHVITPTISLDYTPDMVGQYYQNLQVDSAGNKVRTSELGGVVPAFSGVRFGGMNFGIGNSLEMKVRDKKDTSAAATKKVRLIDNFSITTGYNFFAPGDSLNWSPIAISFGSSLFDNKMNITGNANIDQYKTDSLGQNINQLLWKDGSIGRFTSGSLSLSTSFKSKPRDNRTDSARLPVDETLTPDQQTQELNYIRAHPADFVDFNIPWTLQLRYSLNLSNILQPNYQYKATFSQSLNLQGDFSLTPKWKMGGNTYIDLTTLKIPAISLFITREMHCWQMAISVQVSQYNKSFSVTLNPKSSILRDLKINRTRSFSNYAD
jgi:LPS-assembly protein